MQTIRVVKEDTKIVGLSGFDDQDYVSTRMRTIDC
jgi:hypothetical protein